MRLRGRSLASVGRRLGRSPRVLVVALAGAATALGIGASSWHRDAKRPSRPTVAAQAAGARAVVRAIEAQRGLAERHGGRPHRGGAAYYRRIARNHVAMKVVAGFLPLYRQAERMYGVNWRLIASIHRQETAFSTAPSTYHGLNAFGCCAGPMQFNVSNGPVSTWKRYRRAFRAGPRPRRYPHRTRSHPSVYDDFDAIMAAGSLLSDSGAGASLDVGAWWAAYSYYGHDLFGVTYADQVLARALAWRREGFCSNCEPDAGLVAELDDAYGAPVRQQLIAAERRRKKHRHHRDHKRDRHDRRKRRGGSDDRAPHRSPAKNKHASTKTSPPRRRRRSTGPTKPSPPPPTGTQQPATVPTTAPTPPPGDCPPIRRLLGCKP